MTKTLTTERYGDWACVIGAAEGLGKAFAQNLANRRFNLIMVDHKQEKLASTAKQLSTNHQIECSTIIIDLNEESATELIFNEIASKKCRFLVYNASYGPVMPFLSNTQADLEQYFNVNIKRTVELVHRFIGRWQNTTHGVLLLSSLAGTRGTQLVVPYAASKAYLLNFAEGLHYEFKEKGLDISVCVPGTIDTPNFRSTKPNGSTGSSQPMSPETVAQEALNRFGKKLFIIPGTRNKLIYFLLRRIMPRSWASKLHNDGMWRMYGGTGD